MVGILVAVEKEGMKLYDKLQLKVQNDKDCGTKGKYMLEELEDLLEHGSLMNQNVSTHVYLHMLFILYMLHIA